MPQSLAQILVHLVFSTKNRAAWLADDVRDELHAYIGGIVEHQDGILLKAGSVSDHIHLLIAQPRTCAPSELVKAIKTGSSKWLKTKGARYADSLAKRLRDIFDQPDPQAGFGKVHRQSGGSSPHRVVSG